MTSAASTPTLTEIALRYVTDKVGSHSYAEHYEHHFRHWRDRPVTLLEIGIGGAGNPGLGGGSLRMWRDFFPLGHIVGVDIHDKRGLAGDRITVLQGDQSDELFLHDLGRRFGPFDLIVDDGSHLCAHVLTSFRTLFNYLNDGGIYAIEDLQTSYWAVTGGSSRPRSRRCTSMAFLKHLVDGLNHAEYDIPAYRPSTFDESIRAITFYHNLAFIQKGANREPSTALPPHPRQSRIWPETEAFRLSVRLKAASDDRLGRALARILRVYRECRHRR